MRNEFRTPTVGPLKNAKPGRINRSEVSFSRRPRITTGVVDANSNGLTTLVFTTAIVLEPSTSKAIEEAKEKSSPLRKSIRASDHIAPSPVKRRTMWSNNSLMVQFFYFRPVADWEELSNLRNLFDIGGNCGDFQFTNFMGVIRSSDIFRLTRTNTDGCVSFAFHVFRR